jgi:hypothetical protein
VIGSWEVQAALVAALKAANVAGGRITETPDAGTVFPYVEVGDTQPVNADVQGRDGVDEARTLHVWSRYRGSKEMLDIVAAIQGALHAKNLVATGRDTAFATVPNALTLKDPDGLTRHGVVTVRVQHFGPQEA